MSRLIADGNSLPKDLLNPLAEPHAAADPRDLAVSEQFSRKFARELSNKQDPQSADGSPVALEICVDSLESVERVLDIARLGKNRFEVCSNLIHGGGLTPSIGLIRAIRSRYPEARLMAMIRPRIGPFVYSETELCVMEQDILAFKSEGVNGVVFGCLTEEGEVDMKACSRLAKAAHPLDITFHRAIDVSCDLARSFWNIATIDGVTRILSSGQARTAPEGIPGLSILSKLCAMHRLHSGRSISVLPGSGLNADNVGGMLDKIASVREVHMTGSSTVVLSTAASPAGQRRKELGFGADEAWTMDREKVAAVWAAMKVRYGL